MYLSFIQLKSFSSRSCSEQQRGCAKNIATATDGTGIEHERTAELPQLTAPREPTSSCVTASTKPSGIKQQVERGAGFWGRTEFWCRGPRTNDALPLGRTELLLRRPAAAAEQCSSRRPTPACCISSCMSSMSHTSHAVPPQQRHAARHTCWLMMQRHGPSSLDEHCIRSRLCNLSSYSVTGPTPCGSGPGVGAGRVSTL